MASKEIDTNIDLCRNNSLRDNREALAKDNEDLRRSQAMCRQDSAQSKDTSPAEKSAGGLSRERSAGSVKDTRANLDNPPAEKNAGGLPRERSAGSVKDTRANLEEELKQHHKKQKQNNVDYDA